jgi:hypothetical protein
MYTVGVRGQTVALRIAAIETITGNLFPVI